VVKCRTAHLLLKENTMWYKLTWSMVNAREQKYTELLFSYTDKITQAFATKMSINPSEIVIHEIEKYSMKEGTA
jgi:hypothetical protein